MEWQQIEAGKSTKYSATLRETTHGYQDNILQWQQDQVQGHGQENDEKR